MKSGKCLKKGVGGEKRGVEEGKGKEVGPMLQPKLVSYKWDPLFS